MLHGTRVLATLAGLVCIAAAAAMEPAYTPRSDGEVLERLTVPRLPGMATLSELRNLWLAQPAHLPGALAYARAALELHRRDEDPRYLGYSEAALRPWSDRPRPPPEVLLMRAGVRLARMDIAGAEQDLQALIDSAAPEQHAARLTRAHLRLSQGDPASALADCLAVASNVSPLVAANCLAGARGLGGDPAGALAVLEQSLGASAAAPLSIAIAADRTAAELALRIGRADVARVHFERAIGRMRAGQTTDPGLLAAYADYLLDGRQPVQVQVLLAPYPRHDTLVLRLALAERALGFGGDAAAAANARTHSLARRFQDMRVRRDSTHLREQAMLELQLRQDPGAALRLMQRSWALLREPVDARVYLQAALESREPDAARPVLDWLARTGLLDVRLAPELAAIRNVVRR